MSLQNSLRHATVASLLFAVVSLPQIYNKSNELLFQSGNCPNYKSKLMHFIVFLCLAVLIIKYVMNLQKKFSDIIGYVLYASLLYYFISSQELYQLTDSIFGGIVKISNGNCPTMSGIALHTIVYMLCLASWQLYFPSENIFA